MAICDEVELLDELDCDSAAELSDALESTSLDDDWPSELLEEFASTVLEEDSAADVLDCDSATELSDAPESASLDEDCTSELLEALERTTSVLETEELATGIEDELVAEDSTKALDCTELSVEAALIAKELLVEDTCT